MKIHSLKILVIFGQNHDIFELNYARVEGCVEYDVGCWFGEEKVELVEIFTIDVLPDCADLLSKYSIMGFRGIFCMNDRIPPGKGRCFYEDWIA